MVDSICVETLIFNEEVSSDSELVNTEMVDSILVAL